jgi:hypothetical protein
MTSNSADDFIEAAPLNVAVVSVEENHRAQPNAIAVASGRLAAGSDGEGPSGIAARRSVPVRAPGLTLRDLAINRSRCLQRSGLSGRIVEPIVRWRSARASSVCV